MLSSPSKSKKKSTSLGKGSATVPSNISDKLKNTPEQKTVVGPLVTYLVQIGWKLEQIVFGKHEWRVPKSPSEATKRERGQSFAGFPVDIAVFDDVTTVGDIRHLLFIIECKQENDTTGVTQLESYYVGEPHVQLGIWANNATESAPAIFLFRKQDGRLILKRQKVADVPRPGEAIRGVSSIGTENRRKESRPACLPGIFAFDNRL
jgi:type I restriction enzyme M protein